MRSLSFSAYKDEVNGGNRGLNNCSRFSDYRPLLVNCAGNFSTSEKFATDNKDGRKDFYLMYIVSGSLEIKHGSEWIFCHAGNFIVIPPNLPYHYRHTENDTLDYMWIHFTGSASAYIKEEYGIELFPTVNAIKENGTVITRFQNIFDAFATQDRFRECELELLLNRLLISLGRRLLGSNNFGRLLKKSLIHIHTFYSNTIKIPELAKLENMSISRYNTVFRSVMGTSPLDYITSLRISTACELLLSTDLSINKISASVGYSDSHFFSRIFKLHTDFSPSQYRKKGLYEE